MNYTVLKTEIDGDPKEIGLAWAKTDQENADLLREPGLSNETVARELVNTADIVVALYSDATEFMALSQDNIRRINLLSPIGEINPAKIQGVLGEIFPSGNIRAALIALATRPAARAEKVTNLELKVGQLPSALDVHKARRL